ncbi:hypothetical protein EYF80_020379 [Liparis tanakae]|uniref:Uncharacterized protein n=1 Tax=Liparis tanakae TaxID=230148 RepID=A0A4Z2HUM4_9TELE|nr:hypothetical protein EYF80_020379 [Liparis tanakae]
MSLRDTWGRGTFQWSMNGIRARAPGWLSGDVRPSALIGKRAGCVRSRDPGRAPCDSPHPLLLLLLIPLHLLQLGLQQPVDLVDAGDLLLHLNSGLFNYHGIIEASNPSKAFWGSCTQMPLGCVCIWRILVSNWNSGTSKHLRVGIAGALIRLPDCRLQSHLLKPSRLSLWPTFRAMLNWDIRM